MFITKVLSPLLLSSRALLMSLRLGSAADSLNIYEDLNHVTTRSPTFNQLHHHPHCDHFILFAMVRLSLDVIYHVVEAVVDSTKNEAGRKAAISILSLVSQDLGICTRKYLFSTITIHELGRCSSLLALMSQNAALQRSIAHIVVTSSSSKAPSNTDPPWIVSQEGSQLFDKLICLRGLSFCKISLDAQVIDHMVERTLDLQRYDITELHITGCLDWTLPGIDNLIHHLPALHTISVDGSTCWNVNEDDVEIVHHAERRGVAASQNENRLRRMKLKLRNDNPNKAFPPWFLNRAYLSSLHELELESQSFEDVFAMWDIIIRAASALTHLIMVAPRTDYMKSKSILNTSYKAIDAPALTTLHINNMWASHQFEWMLMTLSSISPSNTLRTLHFNGLQICESDNEQTELWAPLDDLLKRNFSCLERVYMQIGWEIDMNDEDAPTKDAIYQAMPALASRGILIIDLEMTKGFMGCTMFD
jgi:hypothetical protein